MRFSGKVVGEAAQQGDPLALEAVEHSGRLSVMPLPA
jgi:hypothetical protein